MQRAATLAVVCAVLLAGCGGFLGGGDGGPAPTTVPDDPSKRLEGRNLPPGLSPTGVTDPVALADAHGQALRSESFRIEVASDDRLVRNGTNVTRAGGKNVVAVGPNGDYRREVTVYSGSASTGFVVWGNDSVAVARSGSNDSTEYSRVNPDEAGANLTGAPRLESFLRAGNYTVVGVTERESYALVKLQADGYRAESGAFAGQNVTSFQSTLLVDTQGRVHRLRADVTAETSDGTAHVEFLYDLQKVGDVSVSRPPWVPTAIEETSD